MHSWNIITMPIIRIWHFWLSIKNIETILSQWCASTKCCCSPKISFVANVLDVANGGGRTNNFGVFVKKNIVSSNWEKSENRFMRSKKINQNKVMILASLDRRIQWEENEEKNINEITWAGRANASNIRISFNCVLPLPF